ncbi:9742_t:CDS:2 [Ambispora leptoticha]|uniref:9742_t:CDS:1 n=1 Tax=Ambispora leptoticha TaxID=144679 RepID=A0A9N9B9I1_9GLOM|nr:9742_t:CDS:2 [Ambispora leptoticha]
MDSLRLELERVKNDLSSKIYELKCLEKGVEAKDIIFKRVLDIYLHSPPPMNENGSGQLSVLNSSPSQTISVGGVEAMPLPTTAPIITSSLISPMITYSILTLLLIAIIWIVVGKKIWNSWVRIQRKKAPDTFRPVIIAFYIFRLRAYPKLGYKIRGRKLAGIIAREKICYYE